MALKPADFIGKGRHGLVQPAGKCRGREYLRIIYGPVYTTDENLRRSGWAAFPPMCGTAKTRTAAPSAFAQEPE